MNTIPHQKLGRIKLERNIWGEIERERDRESEKERESEKVNINKYMRKNQTINYGHVRSGRTINEKLPQYLYLK